MVVFEVVLIVVPLWWWFPPDRSVGQVSTLGRSGPATSFSGVPSRAGGRAHAPGPCGCSSLSGAVLVDGVLR
jgi:hypothetical protein